MLLCLGCKTNNKKEAVGLTNNSENLYGDVNIVGAMKNVMWKGELQGVIKLDTISNKTGLYGLGPKSYLSGEILINNGVSYISEVSSDTTMVVKPTFDVSAPFFVYANVRAWRELKLPDTVKNIETLETFINKQTTNYKRPFTFKLKGKVTTATVHVQNLPKGSKVRSPKEAHIGQTNYVIKDKEVEIIGFFSTAHKGIFTHHDSFLHMHLITEDYSVMGHLDALEISKMVLFLPQY